MSRSFRGRPGRGEDNPENIPEDYSDARGARSSAPSTRESDTEVTTEPKQVDLGKRLVAGMIDVMAGYVLGLAVNCIPFINGFIGDQVVMVSYLIMKDGLFGGRGIGKNLMGLQVIDSKTGKPASFVQSIKRNIVLFGPFMALFLVNTVLRIVPNPQISSMVTNVVTGIGGIYTLVVIPYEVYRVYSRADGLRWGDQFAGTETILADMDFSNPVSK
ncbi:MAG: RDD family protein [Candidatus Obscuribacterales bacterium]|nr:RDD family protein [Candidatus Obscuribacterales bacterium]